MFSSDSDSKLEVNVVVVLVAVDSVSSSFPAKVVIWFFFVSVIVLPIFSCSEHVSYAIVVAVLISSH